MPERIAKAATARFSCVTLYRDDIDFIVEKIKETGDVSVSNDDYKFRDLEELKDTRGTELRSLLISSESGLSVRFRKLHSKPEGGIVINSDAGDTGLFLEIRERIKSKQRWFHWIFTPPAFVGVVVLVFVGAWSMDLAESRIGGLKNVLSTVLICAFLSYFPFLMLDMIGVFSRVTLNKRHEQKEGFIRRNSESVVVGAVSAFVGVIAGAAGMRVWNYFAE